MNLNSLLNPHNNDQPSGEVILSPRDSNVNKILEWVEYSLNESDHSAK
jgi:hypothetical protein